MTDIDVVSAPMDASENAPADDPPITINLKRRASNDHDDTADSAKRRRPSADSHSHQSNGDAKDAQKSRDKPKVDERTRSRRLFGNLLGGPAHSSRTDTSRQKRADAESNRKSEDIKRRQAELEDRQRARTKSLTVSKLHLEPAVRATAYRQKHEYMRLHAAFLVTTAEPKIYFRPWEMRPEEEARVKRQQEEVEAEITLELRQDEKPHDQDTIDVHTDKHSNEQHTTTQDAGHVNGGDDEKEKTTTSAQCTPAASAPESPDALHKEQQMRLEHEQAQSEQAVQEQAPPDDAANTQDANDEAVDAGEDTIMY